MLYLTDLYMVGLCTSICRWSLMLGRSVFPRSRSIPGLSGFMCVMEIVIWITGEHLILQTLIGWYTSMYTWSLLLGRSVCPRSRSIPSKTGFVCILDLMQCYNQRTLYIPDFLFDRLIHINMHVTFKLAKFCKSVKVMLPISVILWSKPMPLNRCGYIFLEVMFPLVSHDHISHMTRINYTFWSSCNNCFSQVQDALKFNLIRQMNIKSTWKVLEVLQKFTVSLIFGQKYQTSYFGGIFLKQQSFMTAQQ